MRKHLLVLASLLGLGLGTTAAAGLTADESGTWNFAGNCAGLPGKAEGGTFTSTTMASDNASIAMDIVLNSGQIKNNDNCYQITTGVELQIPVLSVLDSVYISGYSGYFDYSINGTEYKAGTAAEELAYKATSADVAKGYVSIVSVSNNNYLNSIKVVHKASIQSLVLYSTDFSDWTAMASSTTPADKNVTTAYTNEVLTITLAETQVAPSNINSDKFGTVGGVKCAKTATPYIMTSLLKNITTVKFTNGATGGGRGWNLWAKGDGDADWVELSNISTNPAGQNATTWYTIDVNRNNVQLKFTNGNTSQNAYMFNLEISGNYDVLSAPMLDVVNVAGTAYDAASVFSKNADGNFEGTVEYSKTLPMIGESNKVVSGTALNGEVGEITYAGDDTQCKVTIPVSYDGTTINYILNIVQKPDFTITYIGLNGAEAGTQTVEKDAKITAFKVDFASLTASEGKKVRGWFEKANGGRKLTVDDVMTGNVTAYAYETPIETQSSSAIYIYDLKSETFYEEDHEAFVVTAGTPKWHDATHGWIFSAGDEITILVGGNATITLGLCQYSGGNAINLLDAGGSVIGSIENDKAVTDGAAGAINYVGEAATLKLKFTGTSYLHSLLIENTTEPQYTYDETTRTYTILPKFAGSAEAFLAVLAKANASNAGAASEDQRTTIVLQDGTYDLGSKTLTAITGNYITIKGKSMDGTVIVNKADVESINATATIQNATNVKYTILTDLTLQNAYDYYGIGGASGRAVCFQDRGMNTIMKKVRMLSYQDTYYSNVQTPEANLYFEDCEFHGTVDYICGGGNAFFEHCKLINETHANGNYITAYQGTGSKGYVFNGCTIDSKENAPFFFSRTWGGDVRVRFLNTTFTASAESQIMNSTKGNRWVIEGMNKTLPTFFGEYKTVNENGVVISPETNIVTFKGGTNTLNMETIMTDAQAAEVNRNDFFAADPTFLEFINSMSNYESGAEETEADGEVVDTMYFNLNGAEVPASAKGVVIKADKMSNGNIRAEKFLND